MEIFAAALLFKTSTLELVVDFNLENTILTLSSVGFIFLPLLLLEHSSLHSSSFSTRTLFFGLNILWVSGLKPNLKAAILSSIFY